MNLYLDIESIPGQAAAARQAAAASVKPPGTLKRADSIERWWQEESPAALEDAHRRQSLDGGLFGEIISIAAVTEEDGQQWVRCRHQGESEADLLREFFAQVEAWNRQQALAIAPDHRADAWPLEAYPVAHNAAFDLGFVWRRAVVHRVPRPQWLPGPMARPGRDYGDTMTAWAGPRERVSLDALCRALGVPTPKGDDLDGSKVYDAWLAGEAEAIAAYNLRDAQAVRAVWHRLQGWED